MVRTLALLLIAVGGTAVLGSTGLAWFSLHQGQAEAAAAQATAWESAVVQEGGTRGQISFPSQEKSYFVLEGATKKTLLRGPAHVANSAAPGTIGNAIIAAHRDTQFRLLKRLEKGQEVTIQEQGRTFRYVVTQTQVVAPSDDQFYQPTSEAVLTLVTCYPFTYIGPAPQRYIVRAVLIDPAS